MRKFRLGRMLLRAEQRLDAWRRRLRQRVGVRRPFEVVAYLGYGSPERLYVKGRVLEDKGISQAQADDSRWRNLVNTYKRFISDEVPFAELEVSFQGVTKRLIADAKGYFSLWLKPTSPLGVTHPWSEVELRLLSPRRQGCPEATARARVLVPPQRARFGVISDIDDTVVQTGATKWFRVLVTVLFGNARTRLPFGGVAAFYRALYDGAAGSDANPLFYVSSSPWNLYDLLLDFFRVEEIPLGPLMLRNWRASSESGLIPREHGPFKKGAIRRILETFPDLPFILIGDSGQEDPEIYRDIVSAYPGRILAVYIRNVSGASPRSQDIEALAHKVREAGSTLILANDTLAAAKHAVKRGWISVGALAHIRVRKEEDEIGRHEETEATVIEGEINGIVHEASFTTRSENSTKQ